MARVELEGKVFNNWKVIEYIGNRRYKCECLLCHREFNVIGYKMTSGQSKSCVECAAKNGADRRKYKLEGTQINDWTVLEYLGYKKYRCRCKCGNIREIVSTQLTDNKTHRCEECNAKLASENKREKLEGKTYGELHVDRYLGESKYECTCSCGNKHITSAYSLRTGISTMCSECSLANRSSRYRSTMFSRYNDISSQRMHNNREEWQIDVLSNKDKLEEYIRNLEKSLGRLPTSKELTAKLDISLHILLTYIRKYNIELFNEYVSNGELELRNVIKDNNIVFNNRTLIYPLELDMYLPDKNIAIEFNGTYWHSSIMKDKEYHQNKTLLCAKQGVRLIHIFEYEWLDTNKRNKIVNYIDRIVNNKKQDIVYARKCRIEYVNKEDAKEFLEKYHLQGYTTATINIGCFIDSELIGIMTFGKPRFNNNYQYELVRLAYSFDTVVVGGTERMFKYFLNKYNPQTIISYCDISKFTGNSYTKLGFKTSIKNITAPNYVWVRPETEDVLPRYKTQKSKLIELGLGDVSETEDEIMSRQGYYKVYDSGNLRLTWESKDES